MIDTDKYEGHTRGPWEQYSAAAYHAVVLPGDIELIPPKLADAQLIADAPLLLADYKRLREEVKRLRDVLEANLLVECDGCKNWLIEEQIMQHPHHTQWGWVCYMCSQLRESDDE
tara:strand:+ start:17 stop:361 length:345 start_codon:yes stop_codon:yes gene_type:complete